MSGSHHHDPIEDHIETHALKLAIGIGIGAVVLVIGIILMVQLAMGSYGARSLNNDPSMLPPTVAKRLAPVAEVVVDPNAPAPAPAAAPAAMPAVTIPPAAAKTATAGAGKATYDSACTVCHAAGVAGAPKLGDKVAWAPRLKTGMDALYAASLKGKGAMPPKGGNTALADDAVKAAVDYMAAAAK